MPAGIQAWPGIFVFFVFFAFFVSFVFFVFWALAQASVELAQASVACIFSEGVSPLASEIQATATHSMQP